MNQATAEYLATLNGAKMDYALRWVTHLLDGHPKPTTEQCGLIDAMDVLEHLIPLIK